MIVGITGTPGTGKTSLAKTLSQKTDYEHINITEIVRKEKLIESMDKKRDTAIADPQRVQNYLMTHLNPKKNYIIDSHFAQDFDIVQKIIVCQCGLLELRRRLEDRGYAIAKVRENLDCEIFQVCLTESKEQGFEPLVIDCSKPLDEKKINKIISFFSS